MLYISNELHIMHSHIYKLLCCWLVYKQINKQRCCSQFYHMHDHTDHTCGYFNHSNMGKTDRETSG